MSEVSIRPLRNTDVQAIKDFTDRWIGENYFEVDEIKGMLGKACSGGLNASLCAEVDGELAGVRLTYAPGQWIDEAARGLTPELWKVLPGKVAYFKSLFIAEKFQKLGIGKSISNASIQILKDMGAEAILCHSWLESPGNSSQKYLFRMDFEPVKEHKKFWYSIDYHCTRCGPGKCVCTAVEMIKFLGKGE